MFIYVNYVYLCELCLSYPDIPKRRIYKNDGSGSIDMIHKQQ